MSGGNQSLGGFAAPAEEGSYVRGSSAAFHDTAPLGEREQVEGSGFSGFTNAPMGGNPSLGNDGQSSGGGRLRRIVRSIVSKPKQLVKRVLGRN
jgi:hypothetical protein